MPSLNLRNVLRRNPDRPTLRQRAAALKTAAAKAIRRPKPEEASRAAPAETWDFLDTILLSQVRELAAIEADQDATLAAAGAADAHDCPDWVQAEQRRKAILAWIIATRAHTMEGVRAKASLLTLCSVKSFQQPFDDLSQSIEADAARLGATASPASSPADPHVALLPTLRQAYAWDRAARPVSNVAALGSFEEEASGAVHRHCWDTAARIVALPAPRTLAGLGALALALSVQAEEAIGSGQHDDERRHAAAIRAMMSIAGVEPLPGWCGFGDEDDSKGRYGAMLDRMGEGSLPAWALAGKSGPNDEAPASESAPVTASAIDPPAALPPVLDLSQCSVRQIARLHEALNAASGHVSSLSQLPCFWNGNENMRHYEYNPAGKIIDREADRLAELAQLCSDEIARREPQSEIEADDALMIRLQQELIGNGRIHDPALIRDINTTWGA